jgi:hypothetical protein
MYIVHVQYMIMIYLYDYNRVCIKRIVVVPGTARLSLYLVARDLSLLGG